MPTPIKRLVLCANCHKPQEDGGQRQTCYYCGTFPLPSYSYSPDSSFHPTNCNGEPTAPPNNSNVVIRTKPKSINDLMR